MKKLISILSTLLLFLFLNQPVQASHLITGPVFEASDSINFQDTVEGDVFLFAQDVTVNATISGDLIVFAGQADIKGTVNGDLRVVAGQLNIESIVNDDASLIAGQLKLGPDSSIQKTLTAAAAAISLNGQVQEKAWLGGRNITILNQAQLGNDLKILHQATPSIDPKAKISGDLITKQFESEETNKFKDLFLRKNKLVKKITTLVVVQNLVAMFLEILVGILIITLLPLLSKKLTKLSQNQSSQTIGWGLLSVISIPIIAILLFISLIGIPLGVLALILFSFSLYLSRLLASLSLGSYLLKDNKFKKPYYSLALGFVILNLLKLVPILGWLVYSIFILNGLGTIILFSKTLLSHRRK
jgi:hypothetical protein